MSGSLTSTGSALTTSPFLAPARPANSLSTFTSILWITETVTPSILTPFEPALASSSFFGLLSPSTLISSAHASAATSPPQLAATTTEIVTETTTVPITTSTTASPSACASQSSSRSISRTIWSAPTQMTDLCAFNVSSFTSGKNNLDIVTGIPASASAIFISAASEPTTLGTPQWNNSSAVLQLLYPEDSINPGNRDRPQGGAQFYATPLPEMADAKNVTLTYDVFFPVDFDWVLAGKLPGLYGGREGCSGGDDAQDCFSTRLMWRKDGFGELYLYAPKDKQSDSLCGDHLSVCDAAYGLSIGRGSFKWTRGGWTTVQQCVTLNTPGEHDGSFTLDVDGRRVIDRGDIFYRSAPLPAGSDLYEDPDPDPQEFVTKPGHKIPAGKTKTKGGRLLGPLLGALLRRFGVPSDTVVVPYQGQQEWVLAGRPIAPVPPTFTSTAQQAAEDHEAGNPIGFIGLFFSTFFGGHNPQYATPRDQYVWFKDFAISYNE